MRILVARDGSAHACAAIDVLAFAGPPDRAATLSLAAGEALSPEEALVGPGLDDVGATPVQRLHERRALVEGGADRRVPPCLGGMVVPMPAPLVSSWEPESRAESSDSCVAALQSSRP